MVGAKTWPRRAVLRGALAAAAPLVAGGLAGPHVRAQSLPPLVVIEPFGPDSVESVGIGLMTPFLERMTGRAVLLRHVAGTDGAAAVAAAASATADGNTLLVMDEAYRLFHEAIADLPQHIADFVPVAKLTRGRSQALIVPEDSPWQTWQDFAEAARKRPPAVVEFGRHGPPTAARLLLEQHLGIRFAVRTETSRPAVLAALAAGRAEAGLYLTLSLAPAAGEAPLPVRPLLTFGAQRTTDLVAPPPTLAEVTGDPQRAFTQSTGLFAPPGTPPQVADPLTALLLSAGRDPDVVAGAVALRYPLHVQDAGVLHDTLRRSQRMAATIRQILGR